MSHKSKVRSSFLAAISMGIAAITIYAIADPDAGNRQVADFDFPDEIPLTSWQQLSSESLTRPKKPDENDEFIKSAQGYLYKKDELILDLEMRYLVGTRGNISSLVKESSKLSPTIMKTQKLNKIPEVGSYLLIRETNSNQKTGNINYLSSCITSFGHSIADQKEFSDILNQVKLTPRLLWGWLWGKNSIRDRRCLWINLTLKSPNGELEDSHEDLEQVWSELNHWWQPRFPKL